MNEVAQTPLNPEWAAPGVNGARGELFVINLCASMTPMPALPKQLKGFEKYRLYQVSRQEDGRRRYRLRLGFFTSEADAEMAVSAIRNIYPAAFAGCISNEDQRFLGDTPTVVVAPAAAAKPQPLVTTPAPRQISTATASVQSATAANNAVKTSSSTSLDMTARYPALSIADTPAAVNAATRPPQPTAKTAAASAKQPIVSASIVEAPLRKPVEMPLPMRAPQIVDDYVPVLDSTLTIRTLTSAEADDPNRAKWFVVQLALSEQPVNLDAMPKLDIFAAYSLYSVALMEGGIIRHALRLGFFRERVSAEAVMGYLKTFFSTPSVTQVSASEYDRFADSKPVRTIPAAAQDKVVNLENKRETPRVNSPSGHSAPASTAPTLKKQPVRTPSSQHPATGKSANGVKAMPATRQPSFLSRLIGRQLD